MRRWFSRRERSEPALVGAPIENTVSLDIAICDLKSDGYMHRATDIDGNLIWPDDPDETPAWWFERQALALTVGRPNPPYRTRREMESAINAIEMAERGFELMEMTGPFSPDESASRFLTYLQSYNVRQEYSGDELSDVYAEYCSTQNIVATSVDQMKSALKFLPAVSKEKVDRKGPDGKRTRPVCWVILPRLAPMTDAPKIEPIEDVEPIRMAA